MDSPRLSLVILTLNEEANIEGCLNALAVQHERDFETIIIDAASTDGTVLAATRSGKSLPRPATIVASLRRLPIGEARNLGVSLASAPNVAFLSADAEPRPDWTLRVLQGLATSDMVFGRQQHAPRRWTVGASVRGLRYTFPKKARPGEIRWASNVGAGYRKSVLLRHPFDPTANAAEDLLLARCATTAGATAFYDPRLVVLHHDVANARAEWRKNWREGLAWGRCAHELRPRWDVLLWFAVLVLAAAPLAIRPGFPTAGLLALVLWLPALRRALRRRHDLPATAILLGLLASPVFDALFLATYLWGLLTPTGRRKHDATTNVDTDNRTSQRGDA